MRGCNTKTVWLILWLTTLMGYASQGVTAPACLMCHKDSADTAVHAIFKTSHGQVAGGGADSCVSCHGDSKAHSRGPTKNSPDTSFGPQWKTPAAQANAVCSTCHNKDEQMFWLGSVHDQEEVACTDCHTSHTNQDQVLGAAGQLDTCLSCHPRQQAELRLPSRHPILEGQTACTDCHNPHGSSTQAALLQPSLNDTCYGCHNEKRGPYLWPHEPVDEDCSTCHRSHGSVHDNLLTANGPFMCQQCHSAAFHPSQSYSGSSTTSGSTNQYVLGKDCLNCHSQVHGSNHPSGARLTR